ncbi:MAG TPA: endonuclease/exonuclease/phosphatase family protein [Candidatus Binatia bacterium]|jgi:endonuclease/exonuclease/phosphatase family metal-dependent hydrolase|nr:endonuclease/exonuclease/phosphatase family protein [Candidatus Binatia bacterium]
MRMTRALFVGLLLAVATSTALATDVPVAGKQLVLRDARRAAQATLRDAAITAPFADPRLAAATLTIHGGAAAGQCFARLVLDPSGWVPIGSDGVAAGWRYRDPAGDVRVVLRPGRLLVRLRQAAWPCTAEGPQRLPVTLTADLGGTRWCAAFGGEVTTNGGGRFRARNATAPAACPTTGVTVATFNVLHGISCPAPTASCRFADRAALLAQWIAARGCPDVVGLQEVLQAQVPTLTAAVGGVCGGAYAVAYQPTNTIDDALVLSRVPITAQAVQVLHRNFRNVLVTRHDHPTGPLDVFTTHLAAGVDGGAMPCGVDCPALCVTAGATTVRECQAVQVAAAVDARPAASGPAVVMGDFNAGPASAVHATFTSRGWADAYEAAGLPACDAGTGVGCTSGRVDDDLSELESPALNESARIDFVFVVPPVGGTCVTEPAGDPDGDGVATRLFADEPNPFSPACGAAPAAICWPSDHVGMQADLTCP